MRRLARLAALAALALTACVAPATGGWKGLPVRDEAGLGHVAFDAGATASLALQPRVLNWTDVSDGARYAPTYFRLEAADGAARYATAVRVRADAGRFLADGGGRRLSPLLQLPADAGEVRVREDGVVDVLRAGAGARDEIGLVMAYVFERPEALKDAGDGLFEATADAGEVQAGRPTFEGRGALVAGP